MKWNSPIKRNKIKPTNVSRRKQIKKGKGEKIYIY